MPAAHHAALVVERLSDPRPPRGAEMLRQVDALAGQGVLKPHIGGRFALRDGVAALAMLARGQAAGKIVLTT